MEIIELFWDIYLMDYPNVYFLKYKNINNII